VTTYDVDSQRLYHLTHVSNLESIIRDKQIYADTNAHWEGRPVVDISPESLRAERRTTQSAYPDQVISDFVPFSLLPRNSALELIRDASEFVMIVSGIDQLTTWQRDFPVLHRPRFLFYDRNPTDPDARAGRARAELRSLVNYRQSSLGLNSFGALADIEFLVLGGFPFRFATSLAVPSPAALTAVQRLVADREKPITVSIKPQWFGVWPRIGRSPSFS